MTNPFGLAKTFTVIGYYGTYPDIGFELVYAGGDEEIAKGFKVDSKFTELSLEVWVEGMSIQSYQMVSIYGWKLVHDRLKNLEEELAKKEEEKKKVEDEINKLKSILDGV
jgi:hypothetical protein